MILLFQITEAIQRRYPQLLRKQNLKNEWAPSSAQQEERKKRRIQTFYDNQLYFLF